MLHPELTDSNSELFRYVHVWSKKSGIDLKTSEFLCLSTTSFKRHKQQVNSNLLNASYQGLILKLAEN